MGAASDGEFSSRLGVLTCVFLAAAGVVGLGPPVFGRGSGRFFRALFLIFLRVRREAVRTRWAVASALARWTSGRTLV